MGRFQRRFLILLIAIAVCLTAGTVGFTVIEGWAPFDSFYMTLTTITTVGYGEVHPLHQAGRIFNSFLIVFGVSTLFFGIGVMTQTIIELQLSEFFGKRRVKRMIDKLDKHYMVCGFGRVGRSAAAELQRAGAPLVVIDRNPDKIARAQRAGMLAVLGDATQDETLIEAGIERALGVVAVLATDADNLFLILSAKVINPNISVAARVGEEQSEQKLRRAGAETVFSPYASAGHQLALSLIRPHVVEFLDITTKSVGLDVGLEQLRVASESEFAGKSLKQIQVRRDLGVIVLAIRKANGEMLFNPPADATLGSGDFLIAMGEYENLRALEAMLGGVAA